MFPVYEPHGITADNEICKCCSNELIQSERNISLLSECKECRNENENKSKDENKSKYCVEYSCNCYHYNASKQFITCFNCKFPKCKLCNNRFKNFQCDMKCYNILCDHCLKNKYAICSDTLSYDKLNRKVCIKCISTDISKNKLDTETKLKKYSVTKLRMFAKQKHIKYYYILSKAELIKKIALLVLEK